MKKYWLVGLLCIILPVAAWAQDTTQQPKINKKNLVIEEWNQSPNGMSEMLDQRTVFNANGKKLEEVDASVDWPLQGR